MSTIRIKTKDQQLSIYSAPVITSGDADTDYLHVDFDPTWDEFTERYAVFYIDENDPYQIAIDNGKCPLIKAVTERVGTFYFGIWARTASVEKIKTSNVLKYEILPGVPTDGVAVSTWDSFWANIDSGSSMFSGKSIEPNPPIFQTYNMTSARAMFQSSNVQNIVISINKVSSLENFAAYCTSLKTVTFFDISNFTTTMKGAFQNCINLEQIKGEIDTTYFSESGFSYCFTQCKMLKEIRIKNGTLSCGIDISPSAVLSRDSVLSLLSACADISATQTLKFNSASYSSDIDSQIMEAVGKGWTVAFGSTTFSPETEATA